MKRQVLAMILTVSSAMSDDAAKAPLDTAAKPRQHAVNQRHPPRASSSGDVVCERILRDRFDERNLPSSDGYFYTFGH